MEGSTVDAAPAEADPQALKLLEEVRFELAEARGEVCACCPLDAIGAM